jgi:hypothetical protein
MADVPDAVGEPSPPTSEGVESPPPSWRSRLQRLEHAINNRSASPSARRWLLIVALGLFLIVSVVSFRSLPGGIHPRWWALPLLLGVTTPATVLANSAEFRLMGRINGHRIRWLPAARLTIIAGAANLLPLPGGIVIRTQALRQRGSSYKHALAANAAAGMAWMGTAFAAIGALYLARSGDRLIAAALIVVGTLVLAGVAILLRRVVPGDAVAVFVQLLVVEGATVVVSGARIYLSFQLIGLDASAAQSVALTASQIIAAAVGIFPAGLGLREVLAGAIGSAVSLSVGQSVAATASDRVTSQISLAVLATVLLVFGRRFDKGDDEDDPLADAVSTAETVTDSQA